MRCKSCYCSITSHTVPAARMCFIVSMTYLYSRAPRFVFDNYTWSDNSGPWAYNQDTIVPSHIPLSALIQGMCPISLLTAPDSLCDIAVVLRRLHPLSPAAHIHHSGQSLNTNSLRHPTSRITDRHCIGPTVGAPIPTDPYAPLAVIRDHFQKECPNPTLISRDEVTSHLDGTATAGQIIDAWVEKLRSIDDPCVEVPRLADSSIFDIL